MRPRLRASRRLRSELVTVTEALTETVMTWDRTLQEIIVQPATFKTVLRRKRRA